MRRIGIIFFSVQVWYPVHLILVTPCTHCIDDGRDPPGPAPNPTPHGESSFYYSSALMFYMYLKMAEEEER